MESILDFYFDIEANKTMDNIKKTQFITTTFILDSLIKEHSNILEYGSQLGELSIYYGEKGHAVTNINESKENCEDIFKMVTKFNLNNKVKVLQGNIDEISLIKEESFHLIIVNGPMYMLYKQEEKIKCIETCLSKLKPKGIIALTYMNKFAACIEKIQENKEKLYGLNLDNILLHGEEYGDSRDNIYYTSPKEIEYMMDGFNIDKMENVALDGTSFMLKEMVNSFNGEEYDLWLNHHLKTCKVSNINGLSLKGLYVGKKI